MKTLAIGCWVVSVACVIGAVLISAFHWASWLCTLTYGLNAVNFGMNGYSFWRFRR